MNAFLHLRAARRLLAFQQADDTMGLQAVSVEKDFWVCWTLRELFTMPGIGDHLTFKGGTSLSKAWRLIERFSEDIDLIVDKEALGFGGDAAPDKAPSNKQRKARLENLMEACLLHEETFRPADKPRKLRMARHYYDLWCLLRAGVGDRALAATGLFQRVAEHRELFFRFSWVDYTTHKPGTFRLSPPESHRANWHADYQAMLGPMFFGKTPTFEEMMMAAAAFERTFNASTATPEIQ